MVLRLKDLIRAIRAAKTAADERAVIAKESAAIRTAFKEEDVDNRHNNISKLLYIYMLGYPAQFGQIECLKLVASGRFADKRVGYLGINLLLDESQEVLTLVTNSLKNDMNHANQYIVGLALCAMGNIASAEMARDLSPEIEKLLGSSNAYIRKKAALCAVRIIRKVPELQENFLTRARVILNERNHAVLLTGLTLIIEMCKQSESTLEQFRKQLVPNLIRHLKNLITAGFSPEHDVSGISDPFLQVKTLHLLSLCGHKDAESSDAMNDILAQVATNTETSKNVGNAILYETVKTIFNINSESGLRVLAINILGRFLSNRDNNIRYVALNTLSKTVDIDNNAVQRHRNTIIECLQDADISIRRRALELSFALINDSNVRLVVRELLNFLEIADNEFKQSMAIKIANSAENYSPNKRWHFDTLLRVLKLAGNFVEDEVLSGVVRLVVQSPEIQAYAVQKFYIALKEDISQKALVLGAVWTIGEFGEILLRGESLGEGEETVKPTEKDVIDLLESIIHGPYATTSTREYVLIALAKLSTRFTQSNDRIKQILDRYRASIDVELQQRSVEFTQLFNFNEIRQSLLERMPVPEAKSPARVRSETAEEATPKPSAASASSAKNDLLGLDLLGDSSAVPAAAVAPAKGLDFMADLLGGGSSTASAPAPTPSLPSEYVAFDKGGLKIVFAPTTDANNNTITNINVAFNSTGSQTITDLLFQAAVPKTLKLQMMPPSSTSIPPHGTATQLVRVSNPSKVAIRFRLKIGFKADGVDVSDMVEFGFPEGV